MSQEVLIERFFESLVSGDRPAARSIVSECIEGGASPERVISELFWPAHQMIERLHRADQMTSMSYHLATRLLRMLVDQAAARLPAPKSAPGRTILCVCGRTQGDELAAQMAVDLLESRGFRVTFGGGGTPADEVRAQVHEMKPDVLLMFASSAEDLPGIRTTIDELKSINGCPNTQIVVGGGVFNRAEGLAEEMGADLWATDPIELVYVLQAEPARRATADQQTVGKKSRKRHAA